MDLHFKQNRALNLRHTRRVLLIRKGHRSLRTKIRGHLQVQGQGGAEVEERLERILVLVADVLLQPLEDEVLVVDDQRQGGELTHSLSKRRVSLKIDPFSKKAT